MENNINYEIVREMRTFGRQTKGDIMHPKACTHISEAPQKISCYATPIELLTQLSKSWMWKLTDIAYFSIAQAVAPTDLIVVHFQDH